MHKEVKKNTFILKNTPYIYIYILSLGGLKVRLIL
jgi:hypothetical protein